MPLRRRLGVTAFGLNQIMLRPGQRGRIHRHEHQEEVYLVLSGTLTLEVEGEARDLAAGDLARIGPEVRRRMVNLGPGDLPCWPSAAPASTRGATGCPTPTGTTPSRGPRRRSPSPRTSRGRSCGSLDPAGWAGGLAGGVSSPCSPGSSIASTAAFACRSAAPAGRDV